MASDNGATTRRYAFVGTGHRAQMFFDALLDSHADVGRPVALCDVNATRMGYYNEMWTAARADAVPLPTYAPEQFGAMLEAERPDAVVVTTPDHTHADVISAALVHGCDVVTEKPLTTDLRGCRVILDAARRSPASLFLNFNYRYSPRNTKVKELVAGGAIGQVTSVHFEWVLDTVHGADYFRRWHREKANSGGLLVHKSAHHFDLVNWWLDAVPETVFAIGDLRFYGARNAAQRGLGARPPRSHGAAGAAGDPFALDLAESPRLARLYLDAEHEDGYLRDRDVFSDGITIEDNMAVLVAYDDRALLTYSLNAHAPWEGYRVAINGTAGRLELDVCERAHVTAGSAGRVVDPSAEPHGGAGHAGDATADAAETRAAGTAGTAETRAAGTAGATGTAGAPARRPHTTLVLQRHWEPARHVEGVEGEGSHGGGDARLLDDIFRGARDDDPLGRQAGLLDGIRSVAVGVAANRAIAGGQVVTVADLGLPLSARDVAHPRATVRQHIKQRSDRAYDMTSRSLGIILNGVTGRMGYRQHLVRSILASRSEGGVPLSDGTRVVPEPVLVGRSAGKLKRIAEQHGLDRWTTDLDVALSDDGMAVYFDAQVTTVREQAIKSAIAAGKHVYTEKPLAETLDGALGLARAAQQAGICDGVVQDKLFLPGLVKLRRLVDGGFFGRILSLRGEFGYWVFEGDWQPGQRPSWNYRAQDGGGIVTDMFCHWSYVLEHLLGPVRAVTARAVTHIPQRWDEHGEQYEATADDAAYAVFELEGGVIAQINSSWCVRVHREELVEFQIDGTHGSAVAGLRGCKAQHRSATPMPSWNPDIPVTEAFRDQWQEVPDNTGFDNGFKVQWESYIRHVCEGTPFPHDFMSGARGVQLAEAGLRSSETGCRVEVEELVL
jgi:predicted dehydrogenase